MKCLNCGAENQEGSKFCLNCGNSLEQPVQQPIEQPVQQPMYQQPVYQQQPKKSKKGLIIGLSVGGGVLLLVIVVLVLFFVVLKGAKKGLDNLDIQLGDGVTIVTDDDKDNIKGETSKNESSKYEMGNPVTLVDGSKWHVLEYDGKDKVTLILDKLVVEEIGYGKSASIEDQHYENSKVKDYLENTYKPELEKSLKSNGGTTKDLVVRTLSAEEFIKYSGENWGIYCYNTVLADTYTFYYVENGKFKEYYTYEGADKLTVEDKFVATLALTGNFWTMSNVDERTSSECIIEDRYHGAYYVKTKNTEYGESMSSDADLSMDWEGVYYDSGENFGDGTSAGIRPVIETSIKNIK